MLKKSLILLTLSIFASSALGQGVRTFRLFEPLTEQFIGCLYEKDAVEIVNALSNNDPSVGVVKLQADLCRMVQWTVTYDKLIHVKVGKQGEHITVYRGKVNGKDIYVPMIGWTHEVI